MSDRRHELRQLTLKKGKIRSPGIPVEIDCALLDFSARGTCILLPDAGRVPDTFELTVDPGGERYFCHVAWKSPNKIGASLERQTEPQRPGLDDVRSHIA